MIISAVLFLLPGAVPGLQAQVRLKDPGFPARESITYLKTSERGSEFVQVEMRLVDDIEKPHYEYRLESESRDILARLSADTLHVYYSEVREKNEHSTVHKINKVVRNEKRIGPGELLMTDVNGFDVSVRGFPWDTEEYARLVFLNDNGADRFKLELKVRGRDTLKLNGSSYECWKVQIGLDGILGTLFPKSYYWYSAAPPHFLVRVENSGMGGVEESVMEIRSYSAGY